MNAETTRMQATQLSITFPGITFEDAYAISTECAKRKMAAGAKLIGTRSASPRRRCSNPRKSTSRTTATRSIT
jgi:2-keto-4-pentenoate hydratase